MRTEFLVISKPTLEHARNQLVEHGYDAACGNTYRGPIIAVEHPRSELERVEQIVHSVDPEALRY